MDNRYNRHNRRKYSLKVHIVLVTKYRKQLLKDYIADDVKQKIFDIANTRGYEIIAIETDKDRIHFILSYDTTDRVSSDPQALRRAGKEILKDKGEKMILPDDYSYDSTYGDDEKRKEIDDACAKKWVEMLDTISWTFMVNRKISEFL